MQSLQTRIKDCFKAIGFSGIGIDWENFTKISNTYGTLYKYEIDIPEKYFIKNDYWSTTKVNDKIEKLNQIFLQRIKFTSVRVEYIQGINSYCTKTKLILLIPRPVKKQNTTQLSLFSS